MASAAFGVILGEEHFSGAHWRRQHEWRFRAFCQRAFLYRQWPNSGMFFKNRCWIFVYI